ncbi:MAG: ATP-binding cassette domain-containing protein [Propionivibrio sp.]|nr:ATP-binding cassette domain-containing protein [Propionivibrio sp.]
MLCGFQKRNRKNMGLRGGVGKADLLWLPGSLCAPYRIPFDAVPGSQVFLPATPAVAVRQTAPDRHPGRPPARRRDHPRIRFQRRRHAGPRLPLPARCPRSGVHDDRRKSPWDGEQLPWLYRNLNLAFKPGHLSVIMCPSGCGKSTLPKLMLGFYQPQEGKVTSTAGRAIFAVHGVDQNGKAIFPGSPCQIRP